MIDVEWGELPPTRARSEDYRAWANALRTRPGQWAKLRSFTHSGGSLVTAIKQGKSAPFAPAGSYEAARRITAELDDEGRVIYELWARWVGPNREHAGDEDQDMADEFDDDVIR